MTTTFEQAAGFPRRILLMTIGHTPQVVTETLYALICANGTQRFIPTEIHLVTTEGGRRQALLDLIGESHDRVAQLCLEQGLDRAAIHFGEASIHVITDGAGRNLEDIRTGDDNRLAANAIVQLVRQMTSDPESALHISLAGGRKTMGFYLGYALSLFGRPQDELSHVLVEPEFENLPDFFFPTRAPTFLRLRSGKGAVDASRARVELAPIPVVSLRGLLGQDILGDKDAPYSEIVQRARGRIENKPTLQILAKELRAIAGGVDLQLKAPEFLWYWLFARHAKAGSQGLAWRNADSRAAVRELSLLVEHIEFIGCHRLDASAWINGDGLDVQAADRIRSRLNRQINVILGPGAVGAQYRIKRVGSRSASHYQLGLTCEAIDIIE